MVSIVVVITLLVAVTGWHLRTRRHSAWRASADARFYIVLGYPLLAVATYWLADSESRVGWVLGAAWALGAAVSFVVGFSALDDVRRRQIATSRSMESLPPQTTEAGTGAV
ncbi:MAG: hypothetical protein WBB07_12740 [Mycobacterium sp.]